MTDLVPAANHGAKLYSPWYTDKFVKERFEQKQAELANRSDEDGDDWRSRERRRFKALFDRLSDETKRSYQSSARHFGKYLGLDRQHSKVSGIVARLIMLSYIEASTLVDEYITWMVEDEDLAPNTVNARLAALRWFVDAARRVGWVEWKLDTKGVKTQLVTDTKGPTEAEFRRILRVTNRLEGKRAYRDRLMIYLLAFMGLRISSVISLDYENIDFKKRRLKVKWKSKKKYVWRPAGPEVMKALEDWLDVRGHAPGPVFTSLDRARKGTGRLAIRSARKIIKDIGAEARTKKVLAPHAFRHFHTTDNLAATDGNIHKVQKSTGHEDPRQLKTYDDDEEGAREVTEDMERRWLSELESESESEDFEEEEFDDDEADEIDMDDDDLVDVVTATDAIENAETFERQSTGMASVDRLFGGSQGAFGMARGGIILIGGNPGIGKSTIARQICFKLCETNPGERVLYASGEETAGQIGEALERLKCAHPNFLLMQERSVNRICRAAQKARVSLLVIDSVSAVIDDDIDNKRPGSVTQVKAVGQYLMDWTKGGEGEEGAGITVIIISHVDKKGHIAGPKTLEHVVDAVFMFEGLKRHKRRTLGCEGKNRFGDSTGVAHFDMTGEGLVEVIPDGRDDYDADEDEDEDDFEDELF